MNSGPFELFLKDSSFSMMNSIMMQRYRYKNHVTVWMLLLVIFHFNSLISTLTSKFFSAVVNVGAALFLFKHLAGINAVVYYSTSVFCSAGKVSDVAASPLVGTSKIFWLVYRSF